MIHPKYIGIFAAVGFVLSFLIGIFSGASFGLKLLRACISAVIFAGVGTGVSILFQKFLSDEQGASEAGASADGAGEKPVRSGGVVDITIGDESLPEGDKDPRFDVSSIHSSLRQGGVIGAAAVSAAPQAAGGAQQVSAPPPPQHVAEETATVVPQAQPASAPPPTAEADAPAAFQPMPLAKVAAPEQPTAPAEATSAAAQPTASASASGVPDLEDLPDIGAFAADKGESAEEAEEDVVNDSEFATEDAPKPARSATFSNGKPIEEQSAGVMAQAIRTILAKN